MAIDKGKAFFKLDNITIWEDDGIEYYKKEDIDKLMEIIYEGDYECSIKYYNSKVSNI